MAKTKLTMKTSEEVKKEAAPVAVPVKQEAPEPVRIFVVTGEGPTMEIGYVLATPDYKLGNREFSTYGKAKKYAMDELLKYVDAAREVRHQMWLHRQKKCNQISSSK